MSFIWCPLFNQTPRRVLIRLMLHLGLSMSLGAWECAHIMSLFFLPAPCAQAPTSFRHLKMSWASHDIHSRLYQFLLVACDPLPTTFLRRSRMNLTLVLSFICLRFCGRSCLRGQITAHRTSFLWSSLRHYERAIEIILPPGPSPHPESCTQIFLFR